jgi:ABC-type uncharacterized transport system permease subunit
MIDDMTFIAQISIKSSVAVLLATVGEIITERSGVLNLGVEGMMLVGALAGFAAGHFTQSPVWAVAGGTLAGGLLSLVHGFFTIVLRSNQVSLRPGSDHTWNRSGKLSGQTADRRSQASESARCRFPTSLIFRWSGDVFFNQSPFAYVAAYLLVPLVWYVLLRTRTGLVLRAVGETQQPMRPA